MSEVDFYEPHMSRGDQVVLRSCFVTSGINELYSYQIVNFKAVWHYLQICGELISEPVFSRGISSIWTLSVHLVKVGIIKWVFWFSSHGQQTRNYILSVQLCQRQLMFPFLLIRYWKSTLNFSNLYLRSNISWKYRGI